MTKCSSVLRTDEFHGMWEFSVLKLRMSCRNWDKLVTLGTGKTHSQGVKRSFISHWKPKVWSQLWSKSLINTHVY